MNNFNPVFFVTQIGDLMMKVKIYESVNELYKAQSYKQLVDILVYQTAQSYLLSKIDWQPYEFLAIYPEFQSVFLDAKNDLLDEFDKRRSLKQVTVSCKTCCDHLIVPTESPWANCVFCGSLMIEDLDTQLEAA